MAATKAAFAPKLKSLIQTLPASVAPFSAWTDDLLRNMDQREAWDRFYSRREKNGPPHPFDWFFGYKEISTFLDSILGGLPPGQARVLDVGCSTSSLGLELYRHSSVQVHICCLDFSSAALRGLTRMLQDSPPPCHPLSELRCHLGDATKLSHLFALGSFHLVLDKGTCDSALRGSPQRARQLVSECLRVLSPEGCLVQISDEDPDARVPFLETAGGANIKVGEIANLNGIAYYAYTLQTHQRWGSPPNLRGIQPASSLE
ncbi:citrate synthase-lysine N-methyltransferase CSKMT, mitochondrial isoform X1 [Crotalus tigris]|uniref:citrate synthase-lysine N-methyltransferase CSKMT, mitochondrial isoform X1 n=2 Tax=Crotalus tigris TaxID=88082 RepID=UPI00192F6AC6|nr:citrate synthase-lysine N-methyltransferase CSKMT, mitochondrial isoform X1 [Crotalus tigris]